MSVKKGGLGRGLDAIFMDNESEDRNSTVKLKLSDIEPNRNQPRKEFNEEALAELADSISQYGVLQPLLVRPLPDGGYQIVAGERRWRACRMAGVSEVPAVIRELTESQVMELALIENLQREDLSVIEEAEGYKLLMETYNFTQDEISKSVGKSRPSITNALRILNLPPNILDLLKEGKITAGHARALLSFSNKEEMQRAAKLIVENGLSVREIENIVKRSNKAKRKKRDLGKRNSFFDEVELALNEHLGRKVKVKNTAKERGSITIEFYNKEDLAQIASRLAGEDY